MADHAAKLADLIDQVAQSEDFSNTSMDAFPRLGDALNVLDHLSTYLYQDGFMPLVRAHAHAAIPLKRGTNILLGLFGEA
jgi:hypothetical protein